MLVEILENLPVYFLIFSRIFALFVVVPVLNQVQVPSLVRISLSLLCALIIYPHIAPLYNHIIFDTALLFVLFLIGEVFIGIIIGFFFIMIFSIFHIAGQFFSVQMGFSAAQLFDLQVGEQIPLVGQLFYTIAIVVFIFTDSLKKLFILVLDYSFRSLTVAHITLWTGDLASFFVMTLSSIFQYALTISLPIIGILLIISVSMGFMGKAAPQMNLLVLGFPLAIIIGFVILYLITPFFIEVLQIIFEKSYEQQTQFMQVIWERG